ncbi:hypothetical protein LCGC14_1000730, partial [marine sediment metagenome]
MTKINFDPKTDSYETTPEGEYGRIFSGKEGEELSEDDFKKLEKSQADIEGDNKKNKDNLLEAYKNIIDFLNEYLDLKEEYYNMIALWIIG